MGKISQVDWNFVQLFIQRKQSACFTSKENENVLKGSFSDSAQNDGMVYGWGAICGYRLEWQTQKCIFKSR